MQPYIKYYGAKHQTAKRYGPPRRSTVVEPFAGGAGYSVYWEVKTAILVEKNERLCRVWEWLISEATAADIMDLDPCLTDVTGTDYPDHVKDFIGWNFSSGDSVPPKRMTGWIERLRRDWKWDGSYWSPKRQKLLADQLPKIKGWEIIRGDYTAAPAGDYHYHVDPPYQKQGGHNYVHNNTGIDYAALAEWCKAKRCIDVAEGGAADWLPFEVFHTSFRRNAKQQYDELLWRQDLDGPHPLLSNAATG